LKERGGSTTNSQSITAENNADNDPFHTIITSFPVDDFLGEGENNNDEDRFDGEALTPIAVHSASAKHHVQAVS
jgi:hypothetical protein